MPILIAFWHAIRAVLLLLPVILLFIEEWGWQPLTSLAARAANWPPFARAEAHVVRASPRVALALFLVPSVLLLPVKFAALWLIEDGRPVVGIVFIIVAKLLGTAVVGRLFILLEPQLVQFRWFARALGWWRATKARLLQLICTSRFWRKGRIWRRKWPRQLREASNH